jgi:MFS family permease
VNASRFRPPSGPLAKLLTAWLLASAGGWGFTIVAAVYAFDRSGAGAVGLVTAAQLLPAVLAAPLTGTLIDRLGRAGVVAGAWVVEALCIGAAATLMSIHGALWPVILFAAARSAAATAPRPALEALMPALASTPDELVRATAAWSAIDSAGFMIGGGAGGIAIALLGAGAVAAVAAALFGVAAMFARRLPWVKAIEADEPEEEEGGLGDALAGLRALGHEPLLRTAFVLLAALTLIEGTTSVQLVVLSISHLRMGNGGPGQLYAVWGGGGVVGSGALLTLVRWRGYGLALLSGALVFAVGVGVAGADGIPIALVAMLPAGIGFALVETAVIALVPRLADDVVAGRVYGLAEVLYAGGAGVGALIAPVLIRALGASASLAVVGAGFAALAIIVSRALTQLDVGQEQASHVRELLRGISFLTPLPLPRLERLVRRAEPVTVPAGAAVITAGEPGTEFYVIADGVVEIVGYGRTQGPGSGFGEIALLADVPRTATVRALTDLKLWSLNRSSFVAAVSSHGDVASLADATIAEHLARPRASDEAGSTRGS